MNYLNANYDTASASGTQNVFLALRLRMDADGAAYNTATLNSNTGWGQPAQLSFATVAVPEPASLSMLALGGLLTLRRRRA